MRRCREGVISEGVSLPVSPGELSDVAGSAGGNCCVTALSAVAGGGDRCCSVASTGVSAASFRALELAIDGSVGVSGSCFEPPLVDLRKRKVSWSACAMTRVAAVLLQSTCWDVSFCTALMVARNWLRKGKQTCGSSCLGSVWDVSMHVATSTVAGKSHVLQQ